MVTWFRYARPDDVAAYEAAGWTVCAWNLGPGHGRWSVMMQWVGEDEPA